MEENGNDWFSFKLKINFTNLAGVIGFIISLLLKFDSGVWASTTLIAGRAGIEAYKEVNK